ncbi:hypothetical protein G6M50_13060 [Agrobacterium rhizogenes]|nr:hypothetical protein [Rhizobium rhizogenes]NTJ78714.1 hypothetical protein [Rhizobium rhizogenes]
MSRKTIITDDVHDVFASLFEERLGRTARPIRWAHGFVLLLMATMIAILALVAFIALRGAPASGQR